MDKSQKKYGRMSTDPIAEKTSLVVSAYNALREAIRENVFPPGHKSSEVDLAVQLKMSRTPVHAAVIRLQDEGMVRILPRRGVLVCTISPDDIREIYDVTIALEAKAAELLASLPDDARGHAAMALKEVNDDMIAALDVDDLNRWGKGDELFHRLLVERCGNGRIARLSATIMDQSHRARMLTLRLRPKPMKSAMEHAAIVDAIASGDSVLAGDLAGRHRLRARDELLPLIRDFGMRHL